MRLACIFPGQGSQFVGMGGDIAKSSRAAGALFARAQRVLGYDLLALTQDGPETRLLDTEISQPAIFVTNLALYEAVGLKYDPVASAGHSFGEFCSLTIAGAIGFEAALELVHQRGKAMQAAAELAPGAMAAVLGCDPDRLRESAAEASKTSGSVRLANFNAPGQIVISGDVAAVKHAGELALAAGAKRVIALNVSGAWHSDLMIPARERFAEFVERAPIVLPKFDVISNVDAKPYRDVAHIKHNLIRSVTDEVLWHDTSLRLLEERLDVIAEFGASDVLTKMIKKLPDVPTVIHVGDSAGVARFQKATTPSVTA